MPPGFGYGPDAERKLGMDFNDDGEVGGELPMAPLPPVPPLPPSNAPLAMSGIVKQAPQAQPGGDEEILRQVMASMGARR
jgi:hypothetical protein